MFTTILWSVVERWQSCWMFLETYINLLQPGKPTRIWRSQVGRDNCRVLFGWLKGLFLQVGPRCLYGLGAWLSNDNNDLGWWWVQVVVSWCITFVGDEDSIVVSCILHSDLYRCWLEHLDRRSNLTNSFDLLLVLLLPLFCYLALMLPLLSTSSTICSCHQNKHCCHRYYHDNSNITNTNTRTMNNRSNSLLTIRSNHPNKERRCNMTDPTCKVLLPTIQVQRSQLQRVTFTWWRWSTCIMNFPYVHPPAVNQPMYANVSFCYRPYGLNRIDSSLKQQGIHEESDLGTGKSVQSIPT